MIRTIRGSIISIQVVPEYESQPEQEIDIHLESGPTIEMCVPHEEVIELRGKIGRSVCFDIEDVTLCGQHARAVSYEFDEV